MKRRTFLHQGSRALLGAGFLCGAGGLLPPAEAAEEIYYSIHPGDTLTGIASAHGTTVEAIKARNQLSSDLIRVGDTLRIPRPARLDRIEAVVEATRRIHIATQRWKYIVVHHSGVEDGNASSYDRYHREKRNMRNGLAYHFVIGNGRDSGDGQIEMGDRWRKQLHGGHVRNDYVNKVGIGICLVGNFERRTPSPRQMRSMVQLIEWLRAEAAPGARRFAVHKEIDRNHTVCPGRNFPLRAMHDRFPSA